MDEILADFVAESRENLDRVEQELIELEKDPSQTARIAAIFRAIHTVKGTCGFFDLRRLETVAHAGENLLSILRDGRLVFTPAHANAMLQLVDAIRAMVANVESSGKDGEETYPALVELLNSLAAEAPAAGAPAVTPARPAAPPSAEPRQAERPVDAEAPPKSAAPPPRAPSKPPSPPPKPASVAAPSNVVTPAAAPQTPAPEAPPKAAAAPADAPPPAKAAEPGAAPKPTTTIRVDVGVLDRIMNLVGELVLARNQLLELTSEEVRTALALTCQRIDQVTSDLQGSVMKTRMQPISTVWNKFPRVARELGAQCGKRVRVDLEGSETELDKTVLEAISEPLAHLIRNSVDHGIEMPPARTAKGKPMEGRICLSASHQAGHVFIEIKDDGAGISLARVKQKAVEKGIVTQQQVERLSAREVTNLIFAPGFSTAEKVTNISGRGVGMDVVRTNIERIGGSVDIISEEGAGTVCRVRLPLTLAIVPAIVVASAGQRFAIPQLGLQELVRVGGNGTIEHVHNAPVYRLRGHLLPLVWLGEVLGIESLSLADKLSRTSGHILVFQVEGNSYGLVVDEVTNSEEIVVKPISGLLAGINVYAGTTILGDGQVALILDAGNLVAKARVTENKSHQARLAPESGVTRLNATKSYVLCAYSGGSRVAVPLWQVERLEKLQASSIESRSGRAALQYRGEVIGLLRMEDGLDGAGDLVDCADGTGLIHTMIYRNGTRRVGVAVHRILDVVECSDDAIDADGVVVIDQRVTTIVDLAKAVESSFGPPVPDELAAEGQLA